jgi:hypothetical protein
VTGSWAEAYRSDLQSVWALVVVPALYLVRLLARPPRGPGAEPLAAGFVRAWALVFACETILDPVATGPLLRRLALPPGPVADNLMLPFVLLGDFRVLALVLVVSRPAEARGRTLRAAAALTLVVPVTAAGGFGLLGGWQGRVPGQVLWLVYEVAFTLLALGLRSRLPARSPAARRYVRAVLGYVAVYYALWAAADLLILRGVDAGWLLRVVPNQLYYALWVPVATELFFAPRYADTSSAVHAAR